MSGRSIPIENLYYLFLYAWDRFPEGKSIEVGGGAGPELPNLLAKVLLSCSKTIFKRGLARDYKTVVDELAGPRGRFLLSDSIKRNTFVAGRIVCAFDELSIDTQPNRIIKAALKVLSLTPAVDKTLQYDLAAMAKRLSEVTDVRFTRQLFRSLQIARANGRYGLAMQVCRLAVDLLLPNQDGLGFWFKDILEDQERMSMVFEHFVRNFYRSEQSLYSSHAETIYWDVECDAAVAPFLPEMTTDITLRSAKRTLVIDTKFYTQTLTAHFAGGQPKIRSGHLYQIQSYLRNMQSRPGPDGTADGLLLYPQTTSEPIRLDARFSGHRTRVWTVNLAAPWAKIREELLSALEMKGQVQELKGSLVQQFGRPFWS